MRRASTALAVLAAASAFACTGGERLPLAPGRSPSMAAAPRMGHAKAVTAATRAPGGARLSLAPPARGIAVQDMTAGITADSLARTLAGPGVAISNVVYTGAPAAGGIFAADPTVVGIGSGIVLSTGKATSVIGPNQYDNVTTDWGLAGDRQLSQLIGNTATHDAAILEFDFVPDSSRIYVSAYAFGSDEYSEFVNSGFNDAMAFYVNGVDCATVGGQPVSINAINNGYLNLGVGASNPQLFRDNAIADGAPINTELDGLTRPLTCGAAVNKGVTNHLKLAIADANDGLFDSDVFIGAGTLTTTPPPARPVPVAVPSWTLATLQCDPPGAIVAFDGSASTDAPGGTIGTWEWLYGGVPMSGGVTYARHVDPGTWVFALRVTDANGATATTSFPVTVPAPTAAGSALSASPDQLWPPDHKYADVHVAASASAGCGQSAPAVGGWVVSSEPDQVAPQSGKAGQGPGDGTTTGDIRVTRPDGTVALSSNAHPVVPFNPLTDRLQLRAEREGNDSARVYTIVMTLNGVPADTATVVVSHDQHGHGSTH
ncbi:MAG: choice-of-anchor L domain-containing protein [Gemmatimonadota bacterium]|nr:choice-of-anchor L domain-containing protein [Gemmatimonadota bacterium]